MHSDVITVPLGLKGVVVESQVVDVGGGIRVVVVREGKWARCVGCGRATAKEHDRRSRLVVDEPLGEHRVTVVVRRRRFRCLHCQRVFTEEDEVGGRRRRLTVRMRRKLCEEARVRPVERVATSYEVSPTTVRRALAEFGAESMPDGNGVTQLAIDEFSVRKGQRYATALHNLVTHRVIDVVSGRKSSDVQTMLERIEGKEAIEVVSMDMSNAFRDAVQLVFPKAAIVADKFHVVARVNEALRQYCRALAKDEPPESPLRTHKRLLLRKRESLTSEELSLLSPLFKTHRGLHRAWLLKEDFRRWYRDTRSPAEAICQFKSWRHEINAQDQLPTFRALNPMLDQWHQEILNYFTWRVTQGPVEGANNRFKTIERQAYGYRSFANLRTHILIAA